MSQLLNLWNVFFNARDRSCWISESDDCKCFIAVHFNYMIYLRPRHWWISNHTAHFHDAHSLYVRAHFPVVIQQNLLQRWLIEIPPNGGNLRGFLWSRWRGKCSRHSRRMCNRLFTYLARGPCRNASFTKLHPVGFCVDVKTYTLH